ncbi:MAG: DUF72 domain-containing protein [Planctomycetota bacterium]|nr:DUF72 domain-containing protein [Planctomycetota bacterium]
MLKDDLTLDELPEGLRPYTPGAPVRFGTSSFSSKDWVGPFYPQGMQPGAFLTHYAKHFDAVEIDATYYAVPRARIVDGWVDKTPDGFAICAKFPRSIVHAGRKATPDPARILMPDATYDDRDDFLRVISRLGDRLDTLLIQFPYFNRKVFPSPGPFLERLDVFLRDLPKEGFSYAVEVRNKAWLKPEFAAILAKHGVSSTLVDQAWMPHGDRHVEQIETHTGPVQYVRLLGDRKKIETVTKTWEEEVLDHGPSMERWARLLAAFMQQGRRTLVFVNNHFAGHAPTTVRRLRSMYADALSRA